MNVLIAEDEGLAAERLQTLIMEFEPSATIVNCFDSVEDVVNCLRRRTVVDLLFLDIQLADGKSFEIFDHVTVDVPIIFTTAYDQYALKAFQYFSIDYLLKPVQPDELKNALTKFKRFNHPPPALSPSELQGLKKLIQQASKNYRERFIIKTGNKLQYKSAGDVAYFFAEGKAAYLVTKKDNRKYIVDHTLEDLESSLNPAHFFRISRKHIVSIDSIAEVKGLISGRLELKLIQPADQAFSVSRERVSTFKSWLNQ